MTQRQYEQRLDEFLDRIFHRSDDLELSVAGLARKTGLCLRTVEAANRKDTRLPRLRTIMLLAEAVGLKVEVLYPVTYGKRRAS